MTSPESNRSDTPKKLYDWNIPLTEHERTELLNDLAEQAAEDAEFNHPASRPPLPASLARRAFRRRLVDDSDVHAGRAPIAGDPALMGQIIHEELNRRKQV